MGPDPVAVRTSDVALLDLGLDPRDAVALGREHGDVALLPGPVAMVELEHADVPGAAVDARVLAQVGQQPGPRLLHDPFRPATGLRQVVRTVGAVVDPA